METRHTAKNTGRTRGAAPEQAQQRVRDEIIDWLREAYAMERGLESALQKHSKNDDLRPEVRNRAAQHLTETQRHAELVKSALQSLGTDTSTLKTGIGVFAQAAKGMGTAFASDERVKDLLDAYSMEHFEIACYTALEVAAQRAGLAQVAEMCRQIIPDEQRMAEALIQSLGSEVSDYLFEAETSEAA